MTPWLDRRSGWLMPLLLLGICILSYGLLLPWLGWYWDDWAFLWIGEKLGTAGLERYFATNRPFWGAIFQFTVPLLGTTPWAWQVFAIALRWLSGVFLWLALRRTWPGRPQVAAWSALLCVVYPGFESQPIPLVYGHMFLVLTALLASFDLGLRSLEAGRRRWLQTGLGLVLALINLLTLEFFFLLELLRPLLFWFALQKKFPAWRARLKPAILAALPYLLLFLSAGIWRAFFFKYQNLNYQFNQFEQLKTAPLQALPGLGATILGDWWTVLALSWAKAFTLPDFSALGARLGLVYAAAALVAGVAVGWASWRSLTNGKTDPGEPLKQVFATALVALLVAGGPFWAVGMAVGLEFPNSRFTLPFMLGASLLAAGLLALIPPRWRWAQVGLLSLAVAAAVGMQFRNTVFYQRDWSNHGNLFWQMSWRIPQLKPGTTLLANGLPLRYFSDNSLAAPLNYIYAPDNRSQQMALMFFNPAVRLGRGLPGLEKGLPIGQDYLAATFSGNTSQVVALVFAPPGCLRVLDPELDPLNPTLPPLMSQAAKMTNSAAILTEENRAVTLDPHIFGAEPAHRWCYYFEKAELARQRGDWQQAAHLGDQAFTLGDYPNDPIERLVFIEAYAHTGNWNRSLALTRETSNISPLLQPILCRLWQRIATQTPASSEQGTSLKVAQDALGCLTR